MAQDLRIESPTQVCFITTRTLQSALWFVNNPDFQEKILGFLAKYQETYGVVIYAVKIMGNHIHLVARFPKKKRAAFMRDWKSVIAKLAKEYVEEFRGGTFWGDRYAMQVLPQREDIERMFFYTNLNAVSTGLVEDPSEDELYNSFTDSILERERQFTLVDWRTYRDRVRFNPSLTPSDFEHTYTLRFTRLPGYESLSLREYESLMREKFEKKRQERIAKRREAGNGFAGARVLKNIIPGSLPQFTKTSQENPFRPLVISLCPKARSDYLNFYFTVKENYARCVEALRNGEKTVKFPEGTYPPVLLTTH